MSELETILGQLRDAVARLDVIPADQRYRSIPTISIDDSSSLAVQITGEMSIKTPIYDSAVMGLVETVRTLFDGEPTSDELRRLLSLYSIPASAAKDGE